jgi:hypothetical protein
LRTIVRTHPFEERVRELLQRGVRAVDEFLEVTEWALNRRAEIGTQLTIDDPPVWFLPVVEDVQRIDPLVVYYTFDADCVYLLHIEVVLRGRN